MKKILSYISILLITFIVFTGNVLAANYSVSVTSNTVTAGNTISLKIDGTSSGLTGRFNVSSSNTSVATLSKSSVWIENNVEYVTITAKSAGTATITISPLIDGNNEISDSSGSAVSLSPKSITITVNAKQTTPSNNGNTATTPKAKSSNNFLTSITVDNLKLNEEFDKEKLEYTLTIPADTEKIKINAQTADSNSKITGTGEVKVSTGLNTIELVVTAENGSKRTYTIKATVEELTPIEVKINKESYTIIRKRKDLPPLSEYNTEKDLTIDNNIIEGYYNEKLGYELVGLKDNAGNIAYYIYKNGKYTKYNEYTFNGTTLQVLDKEVAGYKETTFTYDNNKITSYQEVKMDIIKNTYAIDNNDIKGNQFYLFYARNLETGEENLYQYDALEKTVQRYNIEVLNMYKNNADTYYKYLLIAILAVTVLFVLLVAISLKKGKKKTIK